MTPQYVGLRVEVRERAARRQYVTRRAIYRAHPHADAEQRARLFREAMVARERWVTLYDALREPVAA